MLEMYIEQALQELHVKKRYHGYRLLVASVGLALEDESRLLKIRRHIYLPVSRRYGCKVSNVERNIRTVSKQIWENEAEALQTMAGYALDGPPSVSELVEIIMSYVQRTYLAEQRMQEQGAL